jgi:hypothetical protein
MKPETVTEETSVGTAEAQPRSAPPTGSEFRTAARVLRWGMAEAQRQMDELPWWSRIFKSANADEFRRLIVLCESEADDRTPNDQAEL